MQRLLQQWLEDLRRQGLSLSGDSIADANDNLWSVTLPSSADVDRADLVAFLRNALEIRRRLAQDKEDRRATFYAWHDEMAGQLRFSTAPCEIADLPFGVRIDLVDNPEVIVREFLDSPYRDGISWSDLEEYAEASLDSPANDNDAEARVLRVWAVALNA